MNKLLTILAAATLCAALGCEKKSEKPIEPSRFDPALDGPPCRPEKPFSEGIVADQRKVSREAARAAAAGAPESTPPVPKAAGGPIDQVKQTVASMIATVKPGQEERILDFMDKDQAAAVRPMVQGVKRLSGKMRQFEKLVRDKLGMALPGKLKKDTSQPTAALPVLPLDLSKARLGDFEFTRVGEDIAVKGRKGEDWRFSKAADQWKLKLAPGAIKVLPVFPEVFAGLDKLLGEMTAGINDGSITKENFQARADELGKKHLEPVMKKLFGLIFQEMTPKGAPAPDTSL